MPDMLSLIYEQLCDIHAELKKNNALIQQLEIPISKPTAEENIRFKVPEAAKYLCMSERRLRDIYRKGEIDYIQNGKYGTVLFTKQALDKWTREQEEKSREPKEVIPEGYNSKWWEKVAK